ncbi:unnamed protein product, partial [Ectocarpus sp. 6 AP-2014]
KALARRNTLLLTTELATTNEEYDMEKSTLLTKLVAAEKATEEAESKLKAIVAADRHLRASKLELSSANKAMANAEAELRRKKNPIFSAAETVEFTQVNDHSCTGALHSTKYMAHEICTIVNIFNKMIGHIIEQLVEQFLPVRFP